ncbi:MAG TPA: protein-glutamate O-methyltransferase CheR [Rhodocyclaceae bacterium]|nr:protein-glutamate O-methyltransferase CheR [Rhodocyclaceae bacterium]
MNESAGQTITDQEFALFQKLIYQIAGIALSDAKKVLLVGRLGKRLKHYNFATFSEYYRYLGGRDNSTELQIMVDLLTTNETYFFREPRHFDFLREVVLKEDRPGTFRIWSGASSSGEEAYSMAMTLAEYRPDAPWEVFGSDISLTVLAKAQAGLYSLERTDGIPPAYMKKYCLKGVRSQEGKFLIAPELRQRVSFAQLNLTRPISRVGGHGGGGGVGEFDVIFLRNVIIYFDQETKRKVVENMLPMLKPNGYFIVGHSESLNGISCRVQAVRPTIYQRIP